MPISMQELAERLGPPAELVDWPDGSSNIYYPVTPETVDGFKAGLTLIEPALGRMASEAWLGAEQDFSTIEEASFEVEPDRVAMHFVAGHFSEQLLESDYPSYRFAKRIRQLLQTRTSD